MNPLQTKYWQLLLAVLFVMVLIAHLATISMANGHFIQKKPTISTAMTTRMIELPQIPTAQPLPPPSIAATVTPKDSKVPKSAIEKASNPIKPPAPEAAQEPAVNTTEVAAEVAVTPTQAAAPSTPSATAYQDAGNPFDPAVQSSERGTSASSAATSTTSATTVPSSPPAAFVALAPGLHSYRVTFTRTGNANQGKAEVLWQQDGAQYALNLSASMLFIELLAWNSTGSLTPTGMQPMRFSDKRYRKPEQAAHFDRSVKKIIFSNNKPPADLLEGAQDRISIIWQIAGLLAADPARYPVGSTLSLQTVSASDAEPWLFTVNESETLNLGNGSQIAQRLTRNPRREFDQKIELWFAPAMNYTPVRFRFTEANGEYVDAVWQSVETPR
jgi:outer membrane biosynthesis protein TonB